MADYKITVDTSDITDYERKWAAAVQSVITENKRLEKASIQSASIQEQAQERVVGAAAIAKQKAYFEAAKKRIDLIRKSALMEKQAAEETKRGNERLQKSYDALQSSLDPVYWAQMRYKQGLETLDAALDQGIISNQQYEDSLERLKFEMDRVAATGVRTGKGMNRFGMISQQVGYQVGDFFVQVQSGTYWLVAFGQQATQLAGLLPGLAGAIAGIGLSVGTFVLLPLLRSRDAASDFTDALKSAREEASRLSSEIEQVARGIEDSVQYQLTLNLERARAELESLQNNQERLPGGFQERLGGSSMFTRDPDQERIAAAEERVRLAEEELQTRINDLNISRAIEESEKARTEEAERNAAVTKQIIELRQRAREIYDETYQSQQNTNLLLQAELEYGKDSLTYLRIRQEIERESFETQLRRQGLNQEQIDVLLSQVDAQNELEQELRGSLVTWKHILDTVQSIANVNLDSAIYSAAAAANQLNSNLQRVLGTIGSILSAIGRIGFDNIALQAENAALQAGQSRGQAVIEGELAQYRAELESSGTGSFLGPFQEAGINAAVLARRQALEENLNLRNLNTELTSTGGGGGGGGGGSGGSGAVDRPDFIEQLQQEMDRRRRLLSLREDEADILQEIWRIEDGLGEDRSQYSDEFIRNIALQNLALQEQEEEIQRVRERNQQLADTISSEMSNALMSIADGTDNVVDAFKTMARNIILELNRVIFVQRIVGNFDASTGKGTGLSGFVGSLLFGGFRAQGGPVDQGRAYIVGEKGPELFVPKTSGNVVPNNQMQGKASGGVIELILHTDSGVTVETVRSEVQMGISAAQPIIIQKSVEANKNEQRWGPKAPYGR